MSRRLSAISHQTPIQAGEHSLYFDDIRVQLHVQVFRYVLKIDNQ